MNLINKILKITDRKIKFYYLIFLFLSFVSTIIEIITITSILPLLDVILGKSSFFLDKIKVFLLSINLEIEFNLNLIIYFLVVIFSLRFIFNLVTIFFHQKIIYLMKLNLSNKIINTYLSKDFNFFKQTNTSKIIRNVNMEVSNIVYGIIGQMLSLFSEIIMASFIVSLLLIVDFQTTISVFLVLIIFGSLFMLFSKKQINELGKTRLNSDNLALKSIKEMFENIKVVKIYQKESYFIKNSLISISNSGRSHMLFNFFGLAPRLMYEFLLILVLLFFIVFYGINEEKILYTLAIFVASAFRLIPSISKLLTAIQNIRFSKPSLVDLYDDFHFKNIKLFHHSNDEIKKINFIKNIVLKKISFKYPGKTDYILENVDLEIKKNEFIGIIGSSGAGKSTLLDLISGLLEAEGNMYIDNIPLEKKNLQSWQNKIGYMSQETILLDISLIENIAFGEKRENVNFKKIKNIIKTVNLDELIGRLPQKEDTILGERGSKLSGGEKQRIALARTLYFDNDILLLDEVTSSLDKHNETNIVNTIKNIPNITKLMISHNLETLKYCDKIYELKDRNLILLNK